MSFRTLWTSSSKRHLSLFTHNKTNKVAVDRKLIPKCIHRKPGDMLTVLSKTVGIDYSSPHYKYHDDPFLAPVSNLEKRVHAMAQEAGKKAVNWIEKETDVFKIPDRIPATKADYQLGIESKAKDDLECLDTALIDGDILEAIRAYNALKAGGADVSNVTKQSLLELLCYYNQTERQNSELLEERWFQQFNRNKGRPRKTWVDGALAETLFSELGPNSQSYCALIRGMCKYLQVERGYALYQEASEKGVALDVETYNSVLAVSFLVRDNAESRWEFCASILAMMKSQKIRPNLGTLNALLKSVSNIGNIWFARNTSLKIMGEFKLLGVEPSLATYYYLLTIFCRDQGPTSHILCDILDELTDKELQIMDTQDTFFFITAMDVAHHHLHDKITAKRILELLNFGSNSHFIGDSYKESIFYRHFLSVLCESEDIDEFFRIYDLLVPNIYTPEPGVVEKILNTVNSYGAFNYLPQLWSDIKAFDYIGRENLINILLRTIKESTVTEESIKIVWDIYCKILEMSTYRNNRIEFSGEMLSNMLFIFSRGDDDEKAHTIFRKLNELQHQICGGVKEIDIIEYMKLCEAKELSKSLQQCLEYCSTNGISLDGSANRQFDARSLST